MSTPTFLHLGTRKAAELVHQARHRVLCCAPGLQQALAAALVNSRRRLGRDAVRVVLDVADVTARMGYGDFEAVALLTEGDVDVRTEAGLRACVLVCDDAGYAFFSPPLLVETQDDPHVGPNALALHPAQVQALLEALLPPSAAAGAAPAPQVGQQALSSMQMQQVKAALDANPPQKFDLARKVNVFNAYVEFVELRLEGLHIERRTVQLPRKLVLALRDDATARRLLTTFKLVSDDSKVAREAAALDQRVRTLREQYTRPLGENLGSVMLRSKLAAVDAEVAAIRQAIESFRGQVVERLGKELADSRRKLVDGLLPAARNNPPPELQSQLTGKPTVEVLRRYLDDQLARVFPAPEDLVKEMALHYVRKGVTYETLKDRDFVARVREAYPYEDWDKPLKEFEAAPAALAAAPARPPRAPTSLFD
jgi:hypothetical protein